MLISADEIDFNEDTHIAVARGHLHFEHYLNGDKIEADHGEYNLQTQDGKFYQAKGTSPAKVMTQPNLLLTTNPFYFEGKWAERHQDRYIVHDGFITDCKIPKPWWILHAPLFDIIPEDRAIAHHALFELKGLPMFYFPFFYRPLGQNPRKSGFLTPNAGNSSVRGFMLGAGYYWAINRSYDAMYRVQYFTQRGFAHTVDFRGKPDQKSDFDFTLYGVNDRGLQTGNRPPVKEGGYEFTINAKTELPGGFTGKLNFNYQSSYLFRQSFTETFNEAIFSEVHSIGFLQKHWSDYVFTTAFQRQEVFESTTPNDRIAIQKLPSVEFSGKDHQIVHGSVPIWFSFDSSTALLRRQEPTFQTGNGVDREIIAPRVMTAFNFKGFSLVPSMTLQARHYGDSITPEHTLSALNIFRKSGEVNVDFTTPTLERVFPAPKWLGSKLKHVIEPRASYQYVTGMQQFNQILRFDENDLLSNTNQLEVSLTNRLYVKDKNGNVSELLSWQVLQRRYFDPTFGGAVIPGQRNVFLATEEITAYAFIAGPRNYSPIVSSLRIYPLHHFGVDWRTDYDPLLRRFSSNSVVTDYQRGSFFTGVGYRELKSDPAIEPYASQIQMRLGYGNEYRKGWNGAVSSYYDLRKGQLDYATTQFSYNTDCCGFSIQYARFAIGIRNENQFRVSLAIANIGSFGTLKKQERIF